MSISAGLGTISGLDEIAAELKARIEAAGALEHAEFLAWCDQLLVDHPDKRALVLPSGTTISGDLILDSDALPTEGGPFSAIVSWGDLAIGGRLINEDEESGPFLIVGGALACGDILKAAAPVIVLGDLECRGTLLCDGDNGALLVGGAIRCRALIDNDHEVYAGRGITGVVASEEFGNLRDLLVPDVFEAPDDLEDEWPDGALLRERLLSGAPVLKA